MENSIIQHLQPLFCSRAALVKAKNKMANNPDMDCQLVLQFNDGSLQPLQLKRDDIATLIDAQIDKVEASINKNLTSSTATTQAENS